MKKLGPRMLNYRSSTGVEGQIQIVLIRQPDNLVDLGWEEPLRQPTFTVEVTCEWFEWSKSFPATDELQSVFRCMWLSDIYIQKICRDNGYEIFSVVPGDIRDDLDVFKK